MLLTELFENVDVAEEIIKYLRAEDVFRLSLSCQDLRHVLGCDDRVWRWLMKRDGVEFSEVFGMRDYGEYCSRSELTPLCRPCYLLIYSRHVRSCWRSGHTQTQTMTVDARLKKDRIVCYDVSNDFLAIGTLFGVIIIWWMNESEPQLIEASLDQKLDKITIRHQMIIALQDGLVSVYSHDKKIFQIRYRKSFENPDTQLLQSFHKNDELELDEFSIPVMSNQDFRRVYRPRARVSYPNNHVTVTWSMTVSTSGLARWARVKIGERHITFHSLESGDLTSSLTRDCRVEHLAIVHFSQYNNLVYILERQDDGGLTGTFFDMDTKCDISVINFSDFFNLSSGFYSLFSEHGLLKIGHEKDSGDPLSYQFCCFDFTTGDLVRKWTCDQSGKYRIFHQRGSRGKNLRPFHDFFLLRIV